MAQLSVVAGGKEKRRYVRQVTQQAARVRIGDGEPIPSEIRDYCQTGLYVAFLGEGTPDAAIPALAGTPVMVELAGGNASGFSFKGRVARVSPSGVGVFVLAMPDVVLRALQKASSPVARPEPGETGSEPGPRQALPLKLECENLFRSFLETAMQDFFQRAEEQLSQAGLETLSFLERSRFENGAQELAQHRSRIEEIFFNGIRERIQSIGRLTDAYSKTPLANLRDASKLALVEENEFEDWLSLSTVIKRIEADIGLQLDTFEQRYSLLVGVPIDRKNNPFGPESIGRTFQSAIQALDFSNPMRAILYKVLGKAIASHSAEVYEQLNLVLASLQPIEPSEPEHEQERSDSGPATDTGSGSHDTEADKVQPEYAEIAEALNNLFKQDQAGVNQPESTDYSLDRILAGLNHSQRRMAGGTSDAPGVKPNPQGGAVSGRSTVRPEVLQIVRELQHSARQLAGREQVLPISGPRGDGVAARKPASLSELKQVLDRLPSVHQDVQEGATLPALSDQVDAHIASDQGEARYLAPEHRQILDATSGLFVRARAEIVPSSDIETLVKRLERPLLKLALQDPAFPNMPDHPARQVFNLVEQFAVAADDRGKFFDAKLQRFLFLLVDRVCKRADEDPGIFESVRDNLQKVLLPILQIRRTRIARLQEASEGRERIRSARSRVNAALEQRLAGREVPGMLLRLLDAGWRQYLVLLEMRQGAQGEAWDAGLAVLDQVFDWLSHENEAVTRTAAAAGTLLGEIERALKTVNVDANLLAAFLDELGECLAGGGDPSAPGHATVRVPPGRLAKPVADGAGLSAASHPLASRLRVGDWWDLSVEGRSVPMQLIWISQPSLNTAFANRSATNKVEITLPELSRQIQDGLAKSGKDMDLPVIERSEHALFDDTYRDLMRQVLHDATTGLLNRKGFMQRLHLLAMPEEEDKTHAVAIIEFDQFRMIYNTCGVEAVEGLARTLANEAREQIGPDAVLASFRDDTLAILLTNCSRSVGCEAIELLLGQMKDYRFEYGQHSYSIGFNIGVTEFLPAQISAADAIRRADSACITSKSLGRNRVQIYEETNPQMQTQESMMDWAGRIDSFLNGSGLYLRCQQVMPIGADMSLLPYYEILLGIEIESGQQIMPMQFIPAVERLQRAHEIDIWVIKNVFEWIGANRGQFDSLGGLAINLSASSLSNPDVMSYLKGALRESDFPTHKITFEITETTAIGSYGAAQDFIREIRRYGCKFALDDFGSGFTSYAHLKNLRTDTLKIDGSFVKDMINNPGDYAMVKSMNDIAHSLGLRTVAEYVESPMILHALREIGVDYAQGYAVHKPCRIHEMLRYESQ